jgi:hypothetical protein
MNKIIIWLINKLINLLKYYNPTNTIYFTNNKKFEKSKQFEAFNSIKVNPHDGISENIKQIEKHIKFK